MNLLSLLPGALKAIGGLLGIGDKVKAVTDALEASEGSPELRAQLQQALHAHEAQMAQIKLEELKTVMSESLAEIQSSDKYVARARPTGLYFAYVLTALMVISQIGGAKLDTGFISTIMVPLWGQAAWYSYNRTKEKMNGNGNHD